MVQKKQPAKKENVGSAADISRGKQAEEIRRESEEKYRLLIENSNDIIYMLNLQGVCTFVSPGWKRLLGHDSDAIIGHPFHDFVHLDDIPQCEISMANALETRTPLTGIEYRVRNVAGEWRWHSTNASPALDAEGACICFVCSANDITDRKRAEEALKESEERYRTILDQMYDVYYEVDLAGNFTFLNEATCRKLGYSQAELIGKSYRLTVPEDDIKGLFAASEGVFKSGEPTKCYPHRVLNKDGGIIFAESFIGLRRNKQGEIIGFRTVSRDITERKQAEESLARSEERYRTILHNMQDSYIEVDLAGNFTFINEATCRNLGYTTDELIGQSFAKVAPDQDGLRDIFKAYNEVYRTGEPHTGFAFKVIRKDGSTGYAETSISLIKNGQGRPTGFRSVGRDVTERKQLEQKLMELATHDGLTGLPNRALLFDRFGIAMANAQRNKKKIAIMTLDLDLFKDVNDTLGHDMGDKVLIAVAARLTGALRKSDTVARMGGDEFVLLLWEVDYKDDAVGVAEKILEDFRQPFISDGHSLKVTVSIGIAIYPENGENMEELLKCSDRLLYSAKQNGGDRFAI